MERTMLAYQGVYIRHSQHHASNVILVYNPKTRLVSLQYHVVHDEDFTTVRVTTAQAKADLDAMLDELFQTSRWQHTDAYADCDLPITSHHYYDNSWDLAFEQAQAASQREHEARQANGSSRKRSRDSSLSSEILISEGAP
jgi:hypothetical protein